MSEKQIFIKTLTVDNDAGTAVEGAYQKLDHVPPPATFTNDERSYTATCNSNETGSPVTKVIAAGLFSDTTKDKANALADAEAKRLALLELKCTVVAPTVYLSEYQKVIGLCPNGYTGPSVTAIRQAGFSTSTISVANANNIAVADAQKEIDAALKTGCVFVPNTGANVGFPSRAVTGTFSTTEDYDPLTITISKDKNWILSHISEEHATTMAQIAVDNLARATAYIRMVTAKPYIKDGWNSTMVRGSILAGSDIVDTTTPMGVKAGDDIILPSSGIAGQLGPDGGWPYILYNTLAEMNLDHTKEDGTYVGNLEDGIVYRYWGEGNVFQPYEKWEYLKKIVGHALDGVKVVEVISPTRFRIELKAKVSTTNAVICFDHWRLIQDKQLNVKVPKGKFAVSWPLCGMENTLEMSGEGLYDSILFSPDGCSSMSVQMSLLHNFGHTASVHDFCIIGNMRDTVRFGEGNRGRHWGYLKTDPTTGEKVWSFDEWVLTKEPIINPGLGNQGVQMQTHHGKVERMFVIDAFNYGIQLDGRECLMDSCVGVQTVGEKDYNGWYFHSTGDQEAGKGNTLSNNLFVSPTTGHALETFRAQSTFINNTLINGLMAFNGAGDQELPVDSNKQYFTANSWPHWITSGKTGESPAIDTNGFVGDSYGIKVTNHVITGINLNGLGRMISGAYFRSIDNVKLINFVFAAPDADDGNTPDGVVVEGNNALLDGVKIIGAVGPIYRKYVNYHRRSICIIGTNATIRNSEADAVSIYPDTNGATLENNKFTVPPNKVQWVDGTIHDLPEEE